MIISIPPGGQLRAGAAAVDISDLTDSVRTAPAGWLDGSLEIPLHPEPSAAEQVLIRRRLLTRDAAEEMRVGLLQAALAGIEGDTSPLADAVRELLTDRLEKVAP